SRRRGRRPPRRRYGREEPMSTFQVGAIRVRVIEDGALRMDPHLFFAEAPNAALREQGGLDGDGRLRFSVHCLVVQAGERLAILDTGLGLSEESPSSPNVFGRRGRLLPELARRGIRPEQVGGG